MKTTLYFVSNNEYKSKEVMLILETCGINIENVMVKIDEIQSNDSFKIVRDKTIKAFEIIGHPLFVEHTGLYIKGFGDLPAGLTQMVWDSLQADKFCEYFGTRSDTAVKAKTIIGYCDGSKIHTFLGEVDGDIVPLPKGDRSFQWDCVFKPKGYNNTFAEMGSKKNEISMRKIALVEFAKFLNDGGRI